MKRTTAEKRALGCGAFVELPAPVYMQGVMMGLLDGDFERLSYVLPLAAADRGSEYVRCKVRPPQWETFVPVVLKVWNEWERNGGDIPMIGAARVADFCRGMTYLTRWIAVLSGKDEDGDWLRHRQLMIHYLSYLKRQISRHRRWNVSLETFALATARHPGQAWMAETVAEGRFDFMIAAHQRLFTAEDPVVMGVDPQ